MNEAEIEQTLGNLKSDSVKIEAENPNPSNAGSLTGCSTVRFRALPYEPGDASVAVEVRNDSSKAVTAFQYFVGDSKADDGLKTGKSSMQTLAGLLLLDVVKPSETYISNAYNLSKVLHRESQIAVLPRFVYFEDGTGCRVDGTELILSKILDIKKHSELISRYYLDRLDSGIGQEAALSATEKFAGTTGSLDQFEDLKTLLKKSNGNVIRLLRDRYAK